MTYMPDWEKKYAKRAKNIRPSAIREILKVTMEPDIISLAGGLPAPESFPLRELEEACRYLIPRKGKQMFQYSPTEGYPPLKEFLAENMQKYGVPAEPKNILPVNGSQQALDIVGKLFITEQDKVLTTAPTYLGALQAWNPYLPEYITVPISEDGLDTDKLEETLLRVPDIKFMYILPNFHNPAGVTISEVKRHKIVELARRFNVFIVEDDPYGQLRYEGKDLSPLVSLYKENVLYMSTFSKTLAPGLRLGWIVAPEVVIQKLVQVKQGADLHTSTLSQYIAYDICGRGLLKTHIKKIRYMYKERRDVMLDTLERYFPSGVKWTKPEGGLFLWVELPEHIDTKELFNEAVKEKVAFVPGSSFYPDGSGKNTMRLNFSNATPEMIEEGIKRLARVIKNKLNK